MTTIPKSPLFAIAGFLTAVLMAGCGGGSSNHQNTIVASGSNVQTITVNSGPANNYANGVFTSVTVCVPSTSNCQVIDSVLVDTGSYGLRLLSSGGGGALSLALPNQTGSDGNPIGECAAFVTGLTWGPVATADVTISGEKASAIPVQVIDGSFASLPSQCSDFGVPEQDTLTGQNGLGSNGILGIGPLVQDCGTQCTLTGNSNPGLYYDCAGSTCTVATQALAQQVQNPVAAFATDNNGVIVELPETTTTASLSGSLVFGIGTQSNNGLGSATVYPMGSDPASANFLEFNTSYKNQAYPAFVDSGSNAYFFLDSSTTGIPLCPSNLGSFYCPNSQQNLSASISGVSGGGPSKVSFTIGDANSLFNNPSAFVFPTLGGPNTGSFDWGLPFFFGRNVYTAITGKNTPGGQGPYWAF